ncbi:MAG: hypothetical protein Q4F17_08010 [Eubacteriales bacterium]|nr:hypothetical protein [Eubacteriales bacterium]
MGKVVWFLPAMLHTAATLGLNILSGRLIPLWHIWCLLFWLSGWLMKKGRAWGCLLGLLPAVQIFCMKPMGLEWAAAFCWTVFYIGCGLWMKRRKGS